MMNLPNLKTVLATCMVVGIVSLSCGESTPNNETPKTTVVSSSTLYDMSDEIIQLLKNKDWDKLVEYFHPTEGVRFSPYSYIKTESDVCLTKDEFLQLAKSNQAIVWGEYDGTGDTIRKNVSEYISQFVLDKNYDTVTNRSLNNYVHQGSLLDNLSEIYPQTDVVEYYFPGTEEYGQMDWGQLKLVFKLDDNKYYLIAIIRTVWTT